MPASFSIPPSSERRPATAADQAPAQSSNAVQAAQTAAPGIAAQTNAPTEAIVVTGTSIRGVAPVGSNLISVGRQAIEQTGVQSVQQILKTVPAVVGLGSSGQGSFGSADASGTNAPTIHGLGASASNSTLIIVDSHRFPLAGVNHALADPNIIPPNAIERVEVLPDGASSVYGSDAVAGRRSLEVGDVSGCAGAVWACAGTAMASASDNAEAPHFRTWLDCMLPSPLN
jgi:iron complex outermembrane receptor protein